ncbi:MAG: hypothetical protein ACHP9Z_04000, partial [Streptosporangiales bacterium]
MVNSHPGGYPGVTRRRGVAGCRGGGPVSRPAGDWNTRRRVAAKAMWAFFSRRLRTWLLLVIALPLARMLIHRLAVAA